MPKRCNEDDISIRLGYYDVTARLILLIICLAILLLFTIFSMILVICYLFVFFFFKLFWPHK